MGTWNQVPKDEETSASRDRVTAASQPLVLRWENVGAAGALPAGV